MTSFAYTVPPNMEDEKGLKNFMDFLQNGPPDFVLNISLANPPHMVQMLVREENTIIPPRYRLLAVTHPDWRLRSVQASDLNWQIGDTRSEPVYHFNTTLPEIYLLALEHLGRPVTAATRRQVQLIQQQQVLDLPLEGDRVFWDDYTWASDRYRPRAHFANEYIDAHVDESTIVWSDTQEESETSDDDTSEEDDEDHDDDTPDEEDPGDQGNSGGDNRDDGNSDGNASDPRTEKSYDDFVNYGYEETDGSFDLGSPILGAYESASSYGSDTVSSGASSYEDPFYLERRYAGLLRGNRDNNSHEEVDTPATSPDITSVADTPARLDDHSASMAPSGPKAQQTAGSTVATNNQTAAPASEPKSSKGPHPGHIQVSCQYTSEQRLRRMLRDNKSDPAREDSYRLQGVQLIDNVRNVLHVPVKTFDTACVYYHWFRLSFRDAEYNYQDAAMASLFVACKVEDTIKKSKEILCAAYNIKNPDHPTTQDDKMFEQPSKIVIGLERLILETIAFDFRCRYPQSALHKVTKQIMGTDAKNVFAIAMDMSIDLYKTFAPVKQPTFAMALGLLELTARLTDTGVDKVEKADLASYHTTRQSVVETMLDLLDLYTQNLKSTKLGNRFDLNKFIEVKIVINSEVDSNSGLVRFAHWCNNCDGGEEENLANGTSVLKNISFFGSNSAKRNGRNQDGTMRFVFVPEQARGERREVEPYFRDEYEEYEVEVDAPAEPERQNHNHRGGDKRHDGPGGWGGGRRNHHHDRRKGGGHRGYY